MPPLLLSRQPGSAPVHRHLPRHRECNATCHSPTSGLQRKNAWLWRSDAGLLYRLGLELQGVSAGYETVFWPGLQGRAPYANETFEVHAVPDLEFPLLPSGSSPASSGAPAAPAESRQPGRRPVPLPSFARR
jgi:hypothetical protein